MEQLQQLTLVEDAGPLERRRPGVPIPYPNSYAMSPQLLQQHQQQQYFYHQMLQVQQRGTHVAPRQLPPFVFGPLQPSNRPQSSSRAQSNGWGGLPLSGQHTRQPPSPPSAEADPPVSSAPLAAHTPPHSAEHAVKRPSSDGDGDRPPTLCATDAAADDVSGSEPARLRSSDNSSSSGQPRSGGGRRGRGGGRDRDRQACAFFLKTGSCAYGDRCKFDHPYDRAPRVEFNALGLPMRPSEPTCAFYLKNYNCAFGHTCKYHHPEPPLSASPQLMYPSTSALGHMQYPPVQYPSAVPPAPAMQHPMSPAAYYAAGSYMQQSGAASLAAAAAAAAASRVARPPAGTVMPARDPMGQPNGRWPPPIATRPPRRRSAEKQQQPGTTAVAVSSPPADAAAEEEVPSPSSSSYSPPVIMQFGAAQQEANASAGEGGAEGGAEEECLPPGT